MNDFFTVFGLERRLAVDGAALQRRFYELSRQLAPRLPPGRGRRRAGVGRSRSRRASTRAYRALRDPLARVEYLIRLEEGRDTKEGAAVKPKAPPDAARGDVRDPGGAWRRRAPAPSTMPRRAGLAEAAGRAAGRAWPTWKRQVVGPLSRAWDDAPAGERPAALVALKDSAGHARIPEDRDRRPGDRPGRGNRGDACRASSGLTWGRPTAWSPTWTRAPGCRG